MNEKIFSLREKSVKYNITGKNVYCKVTCVLTIRCDRDDDYVMSVIMNCIGPSYEGSGLAKCADCDTFNLEKGKQIAYRKARKAIYSALKGKLGEAKAMAGRLLDNFRYELERYVVAGEKEKESIDWLVQE